MARERTSCRTYPCSFFKDLSRQVSPGIMKVDGLDVNVGVKGVVVEENRATCVMGHVEAIREKLVVNILRRLLQG